MRTLKLLSATVTLLLSVSILLPTLARADSPQLSDADAAALIIPAHPGLPLAHRVSSEDVAPPPLSLVKDQPVTPAYVPGLPGLPQGITFKNDYGKDNKRNDGVFIRQSKVENGQVVIPPGGLYYLDDGGGEVALQGETFYYLGHQPTYIEYNMVIDVKKDVTIPAGGSVVVGGQVYYYYASIGHETMSNHTLDVKTIAGTDWEWAFGMPVFSETETNWWQGNRFNMLYNQGVAREVSKDKLVFDWLSGVRMDRLLLANTKVFNGFAKIGQEWTVGNRVIRLASIDQQAGTAKIQVLEGGNVVFEKTLGPVQQDSLIEDDAARKAILFEYKDLAGFLVPTEAFRDGQAQLRLYGDAFSLNYGQDYAQDPRFAVWPVGCPTGHNFGIMWTNKEAITIPSGGSATGPEGYFKIAVDNIQNDEVVAWHVEDRQGNRSVNLGGAGIKNIDLVLGQGRVAGSDILKDVGGKALARTYGALAQSQSGQPNPVSSDSFPISTVFGTAVLTLGMVGVATEARHRFRAKPPTTCS